MEVRKGVVTLQATLCMKVEDAIAKAGCFYEDCRNPGSHPIITDRSAVMIAACEEHKDKLPSSIQFPDLMLDIRV